MQRGMSRCCDEKIVAISEPPLSLTLRVIFWKIFIVAILFEQASFVASVVALRAKNFLKHLENQCYMRTMSLRSFFAHKQFKFPNYSKLKVFFNLQTKHMLTSKSVEKKHEPILLFCWLLLRLWSHQTDLEIYCARYKNVISWNKVLYTL